MDWKIEVVFLGEYRKLFDANEQEERKDSEYRFELAIEAIIRGTGTIPIIGDWIEPLYKDDYPLDDAPIVGRNFRSFDKTIQFEIE